MNHTKHQFWTYITLSILGMLGSSGTILADTFFISHRLGADGLAALNLSISVFGLINGLGLLLGVGGATRYAVFHSRGQTQPANRAFTSTLAAALLLGGCLLGAGLFFARPLARLLGASWDILPLCTAYLRTILLFAPCFLLNHLFMCFIRNDDNPKLSMAVMVAGSLSNIVLDYLFIYPLGMGMLGAALATGLAPVIGLATASLHRITGRNRFHLVSIPIRPRALLRLAAPGLASLVNELSSSVVLVVFNLLLVRLSGNLGVAAYGIVANLALIVLAVFTGISQGIQPLLSRAYGGGRREEAAYLYHKGLRLALALGLGVVSVAFLAAPALVACFNSQQDPTLQHLAETGVRVYFVGFVCVGFNYVTAAFLSSTGQANTAFWLSLFRGCLGVSAAACLFAALWGISGLWAAFPAAEAITVVLALGVMAFQRRSVYQTQPC